MRPGQSLATQTLRLSTRARPARPSLAAGKHRLCASNAKAPPIVWRPGSVVTTHQQAGRECNILMGGWSGGDHQTEPTGPLLTTPHICTVLSSYNHANTELTGKIIMLPLHSTMFNIFSSLENCSRKCKSLYMMFFFQTNWNIKLVAVVEIWAEQGR